MPLKESAPETSGPYRTPSQPAGDQVLLAEGLKVEYLTRDAADLTDMMAFFPTNNPTHLITCVEGGAETLSNGKLNPSVQRINLESGAVETILRGMSRCDGIRTTPWGTVLATEETDDGSAYEILEPLVTTEITITTRGACGMPAVFDPVNTDKVVKRTALPCMAWEGLIILASGIVIGGDELRPGTGTANSDGGAIFKFVPAVPRTAGPAVPGGDEPGIANLDESPLKDGTTHALQVSCNGTNQQYGQGCEVGLAAWILVVAANARADANANGATGYYRPEDLERDPVFSDDQNPVAIRFCWTNTQAESAMSFAEVMCAIDADPLAATPDERTAVVYRFVEGDQDFNSFDNLAFQPRTGVMYVVEDHDNGDIFACLPDGADRDIKSDGCVKILSVKDTSAEPTGFIFAPNGRTAYLSIQHSDDTNMTLFDGYPTDDVLKITGFNMRRERNNTDNN
jgi:secreted PhoX family phosphatase